MQATTDPVPRLSVINLLLQPIRVIPKPILFIPSIRNNFTSALVGNDESENGEGEEKNDEDKHDEEVEPEEPRHAAARADEAGEWDEHEEDAECDHRLLQPPLALGGALLAQPHSGHQDRDGQEEGEEVKESDNIVAEPNHDESMRDKYLQKKKNDCYMYDMNEGREIVRENDCLFVSSIYICAWCLLWLVSR